MTEERLRALQYGILAPGPQALLAARFELVEHDPSSSDRAEFVELLSAADALIGPGLTLSAAELDAATRLRAIALVAVGVDGFDLDDLGRRGIALMNTPEVLTEAVADLAFGLILAVSRRIAEFAAYVRARQWRARIAPAQYGRDVNSKTLGIVGMGRIGHAIARRAAAGFAMKVIYASTSVAPDAEHAFGAQRRTLDELLTQADIVCLTVPLSAATVALIGARELSLMRPSAVLVNVSRGAVVDEQALIAALAAGQIAGAGLDVYEREPLDADSPLLGFDNVVALPHIGSATTETREAMARCAVENLLSYFDGAPTNVANLAELAAGGAGQPSAARH
jgi:phosphogluconate 2-dehydrogenase